MCASNAQTMQHISQERSSGYSFTMNKRREQSIAVIRSTSRKSETVGSQKLARVSAGIWAVHSIFSIFVRPCESTNISALCSSNSNRYMRGQVAEKPAISQLMTVIETRVSLTD